MSALNAPHPSLFPYLEKIHVPANDSHKGQNGKTLVVGGSDLFHAASLWSFQVISRWVDMTFFASIQENNNLLTQAKLYYQDGVVVRRQDMRDYIKESDSILIGPGMRRDAQSRFTDAQLNEISWNDLNSQDWEYDTRAITSVLLREFPHKKWVIDAGALQVLHPEWLPEKAILTPHWSEFSHLVNESWNHEEFLYPVIENSDQSSAAQILSENTIEDQEKWQSQKAKLIEFSQNHKNCTVILKGKIDCIWNEKEVAFVSGGNAGMTKGGTGDVLAGLTAAFAATSDPWNSAVVASALNKESGHQLWLQQQAMFHTTDLVNMVPQVWQGWTSGLSR